MNLAGRFALVTGAGRRIGRAIAQELAAAGAHVAVHYHASAEAAAETAAELRAAGVRAFHHPADLRDPVQLEALFGRVAAEFGGLDVLVNSAAIMESGDALTLPLDAWQRSLDINLTAPFLCAQRAARLMLAKPGRDEAGVIVNVVDGSALRPWARYPAHSVSKAGLGALTPVLAKAWAPRVRVNAVCPGPVEKPAAMDDAEWQGLAQKTLLKRPGSGYDVARAVRFLAENDYLTGENLVVDGGDRFR